MGIEMYICLPNLIEINFWTNRAIRFKFGTDIEDGPQLRPDQKTTPYVGVAWVTWPNSALKGRIAYLPADVTSKVNDMFINKNKTANIKGKN